MGGSGSDWITLTEAAEILAAVTARDLQASLFDDWQG
jgi:hypothetical protein